MSDTRFIMLGIALIFAGFLILGVFGQRHYELSIQAQEFGRCFDYDNGVQTEVSCDVAMQDRAVFFAIVLGLIGAGIFFLIRGVRGKWDQDVKPQDKLGPDTSFPS
jgi:Na+-driven multidrug efflux pump